MTTTEAWSCGYTYEGTWNPWNMQNMQITNTGTLPGGEKSFAIVGHGCDLAGSFSVQGNVVSSLVEFDKNYDQSGRQWTVHYRGYAMGLRVLGQWSIGNNQGSGQFWINLPEPWLERNEKVRQVTFGDTKFSKYNEAYKCCIHQASFTTTNGMLKLEVEVEGDGSLGALQPATDSKCMQQDSPLRLVAEYSNHREGRHFYRGTLLYEGLKGVNEDGSFLSSVSFSFGTGGYSVVDLSLPPAAACSSAAPSSSNGSVRAEDIDDIIEWQGMKIESMTPVVEM